MNVVRTIGVNTSVLELSTTQLDLFVRLGS